MDEADKHKKDIDVMILCGGSAKDLPGQGPKLAALFNTVDSYDTHANIPQYFGAMNKAAVNTVSVISAGWDPGLFSFMRMLSGAVLPGRIAGAFRRGPLGSGR
jgi:diaminopimelate dehydrogenase